MNILANEVARTRDTTNAQANFGFGHYVFTDSLEAFINAESPREGKTFDDVAIYLDEFFPKVPKKDAGRVSLRESIPLSKPSKADQDSFKELTAIEHDPKVTRLKEVVVAAKPKARAELTNEILNSRTMYGYTPRTRLITDSLPGKMEARVFDLLRGVAGVRFLGVFPYQRVVIRQPVSITHFNSNRFGQSNSYNQSSGVLFLLDGGPVEQDFIQEMRSEEVEFIDVLKGYEAAIYGSRAMNGVIAIYSKRSGIYSDGPDEFPASTAFTIPGFYKAREFYSPNYPSSVSKDKKSDYRTTLYWNPHILLNKSENAKLQFYTGDVNGKYSIIVEGITSDGRTVSGSKTINVVKESVSKL